jgi:DNA-binding transcriptional MerR regulator
MGVARQVTDPKIVKQALARPGEVIRLSRSGMEADSPAPMKAARKEPRARPPSRAKFATAEKQLEQLERKQSEERDDVEQQFEALERKRNQLDKRHAKARRAAEEKLDDAREAYEAALANWDA